MFVAAIDEDIYVNVARATAMRITEDRFHEGKWTILAHFAQRTQPVGRYDTEHEARIALAALVIEANR